MTEPADPAHPASPLEWGGDGQPRSRLYGDVYFSTEDGLAETRAVFLQGCGLPEAWAGRRRFVVGELGFGTGLNIVALLDLWWRLRPPGGQLHVFSVEAHPIGAEEAARALGRWPELAETAAPLLSRWPGQARGMHRVELPEFGAMLDLAVMDVADALRRWTGQADAWFLDGFAPALNPQMWREEVLALVGARSAPGARAATFTVAGAVRRGLAAAGFEIDKRPGFGRKRERLEGRLPGAAPPDPAPRKVAVIGAGIAGASAARATRALGGEAVCFDAVGPGAGGSGNPAALVTPRLDAGLGPPAELFAAAFRRAVALCNAVPDAVISRGVLQLVATERDSARFGVIAGADLFEPGTMNMLEAAEASARLGEPAPVALDQAAALVVEPAAVLAAWLGEVVTARIAGLERHGERWALVGDMGQVLLEADAVILAGGLDAAALHPDLQLAAVRGQASWATGLTSPAAAWGGYVAPTRDGVLFGATHDRDDAGTDLRSADHTRNLATLAKVLPTLAKKVSARPTDGRASVRAVTPDRLPISGALNAPGLFALTGFGSRGFAMAPWLAEHVAALALGAPSPLPTDLAALVHPERFRNRAGRKQKMAP